MKNLSYVLLFTFFVLIFISCEDNSSNPDIATFQKVKISIYSSSDYVDSTKFRLVSEFYYDGDVKGYPKRTYLQMLGTGNYQSVLSQSRANVPLPHNKFGCLIKNIEYSKDSSYFMITTCEYDNAGYISKATIESFSSSNQSSYITYHRESSNFIYNNIYKNDILDKVRKFYLNSNGLCTLQVDSSMNSNYISRAWRKYNEKKQLTYVHWGVDTIIGRVSEYFFDNSGNNIKTISYQKNGSDTSSTQIYNKVIYKGYLMDPEEKEYFEFDSENRIIGFTNTDFGNTKYKIEYEYYK